MAISQLVDPATTENLQKKLQGDFRKLDEMYLGDPPLRDGEVFFFVEQLLKIRDFLFKDAIRPALQTNQGFSRSMQEFLGRRDDTNLRRKLRSSVLLKAGVTQMGMAEDALSGPRDFNFKDDMKDLLREADEALVTEHCNRSAEALKNGYKNFVNALNQVAAAQKIQKNYRARRWNKRAKAAGLLAPRVKAFNVEYGLVGSKVLADKAEQAVKEMKTDMLARKNDKFNAFQHRWNLQGTKLVEVGKLLDEVNSNFMAAVEKDDAAFAAARNFKKECVSNLFSAVTTYAPPPFNLIGTAGTLICKGVGKAFEGAAAAAEIAKQRSSPDSDIRKAIEKAEQKIKSLENIVYQDHGVETALNADDVSNELAIRKAQDKAAQEFYDALEQVKLSKHPTQLIYGAHDFKKQQRGILTDEQFKAIARGGGVGDLENKIRIKYGHVFDGKILAEAKRVEETLEGIVIPDLSINYLGNQQLIKRYLYLYLTGLYIDEKVEKNKDKFFKLQRNIRDLLNDEKVAFLHQESESDSRQDKTLGMSLPYIFGTTVFTSHDSRLVRVNTILRQYVDSVEYNPFSILVSPAVTNKKVTEYFNAQDRQVFTNITTAKQLAEKEARKTRYHELEQRAHTWDPLMSDIRNRGN